MSLANYTDLRAAVGTWLKRDDLSGYTADLVTLGEERLKRDLILSQMENESAVTLTGGNDSAPLPTGFLDAIAFWFDADRHHPAFMTTAELERVKTAAAARPEYYAVDGSVQFDRTADQTYAMTMRHHSKWDIAATSTNWLLTNHPSAYLFASLAEAAPFLKDDGRVALWEAKARAAVDGVNGLDLRTKGAAPLRVDAGLLAAGPAYDVYSDA